MNWVKGTKLTEVEIMNLDSRDVVYVELSVDPETWRVGDVLTLDRMNAFGDHWNVYNVEVELASEDAEKRTVWAKWWEAGWNERLVKHYFPNQFDMDLIPDRPEGWTPEDEQISRDYGEFG